MGRVLSIKRLLTAGVLAGLVVAMVVATVAQANHPGPPSGQGVQPSFAEGNPNCAVLDPGKNELRIDPPRDGTFTDGTLTVTIDVRDTAAGQVFDWTSNIGVDSIFVKGGSDGNFYRYDPPAEDTGDTGLHAPVNHSNNTFFGLSHISFCYDVNPDVGVVKTPDGGTVNAGDTATFSITVTNNGPGASNVTLSDTLPDGGLNWTEASDPSNSCTVSTAPPTPQTLTCNFGSVPEGEQRTVSVSTPTSTDDCGTKNNTVTITASDDNTPGNNSDTGSIMIQCPDVSVQKTPDAGTVSAGSNAVFSITVTNNGPGSAANVTLNDPLPNGGLNWSITSQPAGNPCQITGSVGSQTLSCSFGTLAQGATRTVEVTSPTLQGSGSCGVKNNVATVSATGDTNSGNNTDSGQITVSCPDISVTKEGNGSVDVGGVAQFTMVITNNGPGTATGVSLTDDLPGSGWTIFSQTGSACSVSAGGGSLSCSGITLSQSGTYTVVVRKTTTAADCGPMPNTVSVSSTNEGASQTGNNTANATVMVNCPDVSVVKTPDAGSVNAGQPATFSITVTNNGPGSATNVTLNDPLPNGGLNWSIATQPAGNPCQITGAVGSQVLSCGFGTLAQGATRTVEVSTPTLQGAGSCGIKNNVATVSATVDSNSQNNSDAGQITVSCPDVSVTKQGNGPVAVGGVARFTMVVTNNGPGTATNVSLTDDLPGAGWAIESQTASACSVDGTGSNLTCSLVTLAQGASYQVVVAKTTTLADCGPMANTVTVSSSNEGPNQSGNNTANASIMVECATIRVEKQTLPDGSSNQFEFTGEINASLSDGQGQSKVVAPGQYSVQEAAEAGWDLTSIVCTGDATQNSSGNVGARTASFDVAAGESITCVFTNTQRGTIIVEKQTSPDGAAGSFTFTGDAAGTIGDNGQIVVSNLQPGTYTATEQAAAGFNLTSIACGDANSTGNLATRTATFNLGAGETVKCTFTNQLIPVILGQGAIDVQKSADLTSVKEPGGPVSFSVRITNTSNVNVTVTSVVDSVFGDLDDDGGAGVFDVPLNLGPGQSQTQTFQRQVTGSAGQTHVNVVTASGNDQHGNPVSDSDDARVEITPRLIDLAIVKSATTPTPLNGTVTYTMTVTNRGPDTATNVQLADPAPAAISYLTVNTSQGTCNLTTSLITCSLGTIAPGQTVTITVTARATAVGTHTNTATVTGQGGRETNPADNVDDAVTIVPAPFVPPTAPKPEPKPVCITLTVSPKMIKADGKPDRVSVKVTAGKKRMKGVKVVILGSGVRKTGRSNAKGMVHLTINPKRAGLITITALETNQRVCGPKRIGVVGVFLPPLTG